MTRNAIDLVYHQGIYKCVACGHLFRDPAYNFEYSFYVNHAYWYNDPFWPIFQKTYFAFFERYMKEDVAAIELGAANGDFLFYVWKFLREKVSKNPKIYYNELEDIVSLKNEFLIPKENRLIGPMEKVSFNGLQFGNVFLIEVLEHFKYPKESMCVLEDITKKGGKVHIATDNGDHLNAVDMMFRHQEHLNIFTERSFNTLIASFNFRKLFFWSSPVGKSYTVLEKI
jgi:hypothetical protein